MHLFTVLYLVGLLIGIGFYSLTFFLSKEMKDKERQLYLFAGGSAIVLGGLIVGGFEGMPISIVGLGVITISVVVALLIRMVWRKYILTFTVLFIVGVFVFHYLDKTDYWIIKKENEYATPGDEVYNYLSRLQAETDIKGFKVIDMADSNAIILSLGHERSGNSIEVMDIEELNSKTIIHVKSFYNKSVEKNPTVIIGVDRLNSEVEIRDVDGTVYQQIKE